MNKNTFSFETEVDLDINIDNRYLEDAVGFPISSWTVTPKKITIHWQAIPNCTRSYIAGWTIVLNPVEIQANIQVEGDNGESTEIIYCVTTKNVQIDAFNCVVREKDTQPYIVTELVPYELIVDHEGNCVLKFSEN